MQSLLILGRQPALGLAELESLYGAAAVRAVKAAAPSRPHAPAYQAALLDIPARQVAFERLGGSVKLAKVLSTVDSIDWREIDAFLIKTVPRVAAGLPEGKLQLGLSAYGLRAGPPQLLATGLSLKKAIKQAGRTLRLTPNKETDLSSGSVLHNNLTGPSGMELLLVRDGQQTLVAQTAAVQDIASYTRRDRGRPKRDPRVGMLPPKLAQIIINLAGRHVLLAGAAPRPTAQPPQPARLLDPFCGTGVVLQEALLMGYEACGTDVEPRMVEYSRTNLAWLLEQHKVAGAVHLEMGDATTHKWRPLPDIVASETYLGRPFTSLPAPGILQQTAADCNLITKKFLQNIGQQIKPGTRLCLAVPAWQVKPDMFQQLPLIDHLAELGYNRISFEHVRDDDLIYYRADQVVARQLLVLEKR